MSDSKWHKRNRRQKPQQQQNHHHQQQEREEGDEEIKPSNLLSSDPQICLAIYVAMAHAGLALSLALLYGLAKLLQEYWRPIQWAILCSMPLRELHTTLVRFWSHPLKLGLVETLIAIPIAVLQAATGSLIDSHHALLRLLRSRPPLRPNEKIGFSKLMQWVSSFGVFVVGYERVGFAAVPAIAAACLVAYSTGYGAPMGPGIVRTLTALSSVRRSGGGLIVGRRRSFCSRISRYCTSLVLKRLKIVIGIGLIAFMIASSVSGFVLFSYKIGMEGKDAVLSLKTHMQESNYAERIGLNQWMEENEVPELIDAYMLKFYETLSQQIDSLALYYNVTEIVEGVQRYLIRPIAERAPEQESGRSFLNKFYALVSRAKKREWIGIYKDSNAVLGEMMSSRAWRDLVEKVRGFVLHSLDVPKRVFASGSMVLMGGANIFFSFVVSIVSGAAELLNIISQLMVFFWLLYYLITSDSGGVMDHVLGMLPISKLTRVRCAEVLDRAVSNVLLAAAKITFFQGCVTYLLFRFYRIHFLYVSTFLAVMSAVLPITPTWLSSIPAAAQLAMEARYVEAILLSVAHLLLLDYGTAAIHDEIPGHSAYFTGLSILGGMALFPSALEGAIMGPLLMTVMIALKNLYVEFVLVYAKETGK